uniref:HDC19347 n=1 Tax=Drosophila melanogaster TaxID=7227 RepID=Q6II97_DROME|nr:TPA_inf: HDC19347 [Drosophila melanogaster]
MSAISRLFPMGKWEMQMPMEIIYGMGEVDRTFHSYNRHFAVQPNASEILTKFHWP